MIKDIIRHRGRNVDLHKLFPSMITIIGLCFGIISIHYAVDKKFDYAVIFVILAAFIDGIDGKIARLLKSTSTFGAHLDSLSDLVSFGVAPGIIMHVWLFDNDAHYEIGEAIILVYIICSALRLARFNNDQIIENSHKVGCGAGDSDDLSDDIASHKKNFFSGLPVPAAAIICLTPLMMQFKLLSGYHFNTLFIVVYIFCVGMLMVSKLPMLSFKYTKIQSKYIPFLFILLCIIVLTSVIEPWVVMPILSVVYATVLIPLGVIAYYRGHIAFFSKR